MLKWLKLIERDHSGHLRPHEHTSYIVLFIILAVVGLALTTYTVNADNTPHPLPQASSISLTGSVPGKVPTVAATIATPKDQQHFSTSPVTISGTCPANTLVEIFKTNIFAGSTPCNDAGTYSIDIDMLIGKNELIAKVYNSMNEAGPDSNMVVSYYDALPSQAGPIVPLGLSGAQLILNTDAVFRGTFPNQDLNVPIDILGGTAPYAVNIQWGDSTNKVIPRNDNSTFSADHIYSKPGTYQISLQATDANGRVAFLTVAAIVNGQPTTASISATSQNLQVLWPLYVGAIAAVISFWVGEKREKRILRTRGLLYE